jgi:protoheme IX farnesyltransferase
MLWLDMATKGGSSHSAPTAAERAEGAGVGVPVPSPGIEAFSRSAIGLLAYLLAVLLFGAFVRASLSGDGCGTSWPLCDGGLLPMEASSARIIEFTHRASSGLLLLLMAGLSAWSRALWPRRHFVRTASAVALAATVVSALVGAALVVFQWVTHDKSAGRAVAMPLHLVNNYVLVAALVAAVFAARTGRTPTFKGQGQVGSGVKWAAAGVFALGATGALSALGKTAFEHELASVRGIAERIALHVAPDAHPLLRGGVVHPLIATSVGLLIVWVCGLLSQARPAPEVRRWARWTVGLYVAQMAFGLVNLLVSAPVGMQLGHLALALAGWIALTMMSLHALTASPVPDDEAPEPSAPRPLAAWTGRAKDYVALTKPRVVSLLLFTTVAAMVVAQKGMPDPVLALFVCLGGYMAAGAAHAFNMVMESDIDLAMERTARRPIVERRVSKREASGFAWILTVGSFAVLWWSANLLAALLALAGLICYVFVYTLWLKRRTWQNIVIGGAAGAFPPLVGYAAVSGELSPLAWTLFAVILAWTPVHFWALALLVKDDYARAGVPMLPVVKGERVTVNQIGLYAVATSLVSVLPFAQGQAGPFYLVGSVALNIGLIAQSLRLWRTAERPQARALFKYSMAYLSLFFVVVAIDQARWY